MHDEGDIKSYRKKVKSVEALAFGQLLASIIERCPRFRLLVIGNSGVGKSSLLCKVFGTEFIHTSTHGRGIAEINQEFISPTNERFVVHESLGFEPGDERNMEIVNDFVKRRMAMPEPKDQLHAVWLCLELPYSGGRLLDAGAEEFLKRRQEFLGQIPLVVVLTKGDQLDIQLEFDPPENEDIQQYKSRYLDKFCFGPLYEAAGRDIAHAIVSTHDDYSESLSALVEATLENMGKYHVDEAPRFITSIAQRVSVKEKIELSIAIGKQRYREMLLNAVFGGHRLQKYLRVIRNVVIPVWNFHDPDQCLMNDDIIRTLLRTDNLGNSSEVPLTTSPATSVTSPQGLLSGSGETPSLVAPTNDRALSVAQIAHAAETDVKLVMSYFVDLVCTMQAIFLSSFGSPITVDGVTFDYPATVDRVAFDDPVTVDRVTFALRAYEQSRKTVHQKVDAFNWGLEHGHVLDKVEELIWSIKIEEPK